MRMKHSLSAGLLVAGLAIVQPASAAVNLLTNGSFEDPVINALFVNTTSVPGWTVTTNNVDIVRRGGGFGIPAAGYDGDQMLDLVGFGTTGAIEQSFATIVGQTYSLVFGYSNNPVSLGTASARVDVVGSSVLLSGTVTHSGATTNDLGWITFSNSFVANSTTTTLSFTNTIGFNNGGVYLDGIVVSEVSSAVPEPATWAMMLIGFAGLGYAARRREAAAA